MKVGCVVGVIIEVVVAAIVVVVVKVFDVVVKVEFVSDTATPVRKYKTIQSIHVCKVKISLSS